MATEPRSFRIQIDPDARLAAAVGGAARYLADAAGMENGKVEQFRSSVVAACIGVFPHLTGDHPQLQVALTRFPDRIEIALFHQGDASRAVGLDSSAGFAARPGGGEARAHPFGGFDRVQYEAQGEESVTRLTKYIGKVAPGS